MNKFGAYKIFTTERLIIEYHFGDINIDDFIESRKIISSDQEYNPDFDVIFDFRNANMIVDEKDIKRFVEFFKKYTPIMGKRHSAYLTSKPNQVVITTLFSINIEGAPISPMTFSTFEGVVNWLNSKNLKKDDLANIIDELKTRSDNIYE